MDVVPYTGHVDPGAPGAGRQLPGLGVTKMSVGPMDNNAYVLTCLATKERLLIDAANDAPTLLRWPGISTIVTTHQHWDHWQALAEVAAATGARTVAHPLDAEPLPVVPDRLVEAGDEITVGEQSLRVIHLRGHTPGSIALLFEPAGGGDPHLFTGDCLFPGGAGNTQKDAERFTQLLDDLEERVFGPLPDGTWIYPGHGNDTTLGAERPHLAEWRTRGW